MTKVNTQEHCTHKHVNTLKLVSAKIHTNYVSEILQDNVTAWHIPARTCGYKPAPTVSSAHCRNFLSILLTSANTLDKFNKSARETPRMRVNIKKQLFRTSTSNNMFSIIIPN